MIDPYQAKSQNYLITILFHMAQPRRIMHYLLTKEEMKMAFGGIDGVAGAACCSGAERGVGAGIAAVVIIILLLIAMGIVF